MRMRYRQLVKFTNAEGRVVELWKSEEKRQFLFKTMGCTGGLQHFKCCTPHALHDDKLLLCVFCCYNTAEWVEAGRGVLPVDEAWFAALLKQQGVSVFWCHQVTCRGWHGRFDYYNWKLKVLVQSDGPHHFVGSKISAVSQQDCECNVMAFQHGWALVRVHVVDLSQPQVVMAAIATAAQYRAVVFTASYWGLGFWHVQNLKHALQHAHAPACCPYGNLIFKHGNTPT